METGCSIFISNKQFELVKPRWLIEIVILMNLKCVFIIIAKFLISFNVVFPEFGRASLIVVSITMSAVCILLVNIKCKTACTLYFVYDAKYCMLCKQQTVQVMAFLIFGVG